MNNKDNMKTDNKIDNNEAKTGGFVFDKGIYLFFSC